MPLTTDTTEYCFHLAALVESYPNPTDEAQRLVREGRRMCGEGHVIGGLARLRKAFIIVQGDTVQH